MKNTKSAARWALEFQAHKIKIEYRKGALNHAANALSRIYEEEE